MAILRKLTDYAYLLETNTKEKIGIVVDYSSSSSDKTGIEFFSTAGRIDFSSLKALEDLIGDEIKYEAVKIEETENTKFIDDYPVNSTDSIYDIQEDNDIQFKTFSKSKRSKKRFLPGWWIISNTEANTHTPRLTLSKDIYKEKKLNGELYGPFKTYMEVTYQIKKL